jgi:hypothetical protein
MRPPVGSGPFVMILALPEETGRTYYLEDFYPEFADGRGYANWTDDPAKAMRFPSMAEALDLWRTQSRVRPLRDDGLPNRPLTAYSIMVEAR